MDSPPPSKGIIFDFDGTLYGDWRLWISLIEETLREFNLSVTAYEALELARNEIRTGEAKETIKISGIAVSLAREQGLEHDDEVRSRFFEKLDAKMDDTGPGNDLVRLLEQLQHEKFIMGLVTFVRKTRLTRRLNTWKIGHFFRSAITPEQVAEFKPSPQPYRKAIEDFHLAPQECVVVGDEPVDMIGGKRAGTRTIGLPQGFYSREELVEAGADTIITSLNELPSILFN
jgi:HAD superfamily hydrolase (TIGR01509 family)